MKFNSAGFLSLNAASSVAEYCRFRGVCAESIREKIDAKRTLLSAEKQLFSITEMEKHLKNFAPDWLDELRMLDEVLDLPERSMLEYLGYINLVNEKFDCTSWIVMPELTANGKVIMHKNRDNSENDHAPLFFRTPGKFAWTGSCGRMLPYPRMGINEKGLAVAMNSGEVCKEWNLSGFSTSMIARLMLEQCSTPDECVALLEEMRKAGAYSHGNRGSIFLYATSSYAGVTEMCAARSQHINLDFGYMIRANAWHLPGMTAMSEAASENIFKYNIVREHMVRDGLRAAVNAGGVTSQNCFAITRDRGRMLPQGQIPVCRPSTIATSTFEFDPDFPLLNTVYHCSGPARNTIFIPFAFGAGALPDHWVSGEWTRRAFKFRSSRGIDHVLTPQLEEVESELCRRHERTLEKARCLLCENKENQAVALLQESALSGFEFAEEAFRDITGF
ncbi:MAG: hypothetical protein IKA87_02475 [Lentisphaeria bacterium]|nr:hypothetical protein [Lentisphaeria bacterium]